MNDISKVSPYRIDGFFETKTNCITKIPQDIKLELIEGTLIIKAGSKVYIPNGINVFKEYITKTDISVTDVSPRSVMIVINESDEYDFYDLNDTYSGDASPNANPFGLWYDTLNNLIKVTKTSGTTWTDGWSLPICIMTSISTTGFTSIDQIFNGFGYIGNTIFALPGIEGLIPQGRNTNNEIINKSFITNKVLITTNGGSTDTRNIILSDTICDHPELSGYDDINNIIWRDNFEHTDYYQLDCMVCCQVSYTNGRVTSFNPKTVFQAVDLSNIDYVIETYFNNGNWYRKYKSGWIEQGGTFNGTADSEFTVPFNIPFVNIPYVNTSSFGAKSNAQLFFKNQGYNATTTNFKFTGWCPIIWYACGF